MKKQITLYVEPELYKQFQIWCLQQNTNVTQEFQKFIKEKLGE